VKEPEESNHAKSGEENKDGKERKPIAKTSSYPTRSNTHRDARQKNTRA
jgi:hypothetical protein